MANRNIDDKKLLGFYHTVEGMLIIPPASDFFVKDAYPARVNPFAVSTVQEFPLGTQLWWGDRKFRYAKSGGTIGVGKLVQDVVPLAGHIDEVVNSPAADSTTIAFTPAVAVTDDLAANELADGYVYINDDTGEGYLHKIRSHPAITGATSGTLTLYDPIEVTLGDNATATVYHAPGRNFIIHPSPPTAMLRGVVVSRAGVVANDYCWLQYEGPCPVLTDGTIIIGAGVMASDNVDGSVEHWVPETDTGGEVESMGPLGFVMAVNADTEYSLIWLKLPG